MSRPISSGQRYLGADTFQLPDTLKPTPKTFLVPPKGMDTASRLNMLGPDTCRLVQNLTIVDGSYKTRDATSIVGDTAGSPVIYAGEFLLSTGDSYMVRWTETRVEFLEAGVWVPCNGVPVAGSSLYGLALTGWNDTIVFSTQIGKLYVLTFLPTPTITELVNAPTGVYHLTTFANRIIATTKDGLYWCISRDNTRWDPNDPLFPGAGFEPLLSSPGGRVDGRTGVIPVTDEIAYVVRTSSIWQMSQTGNPDAPFAFSQIYNDVGGLYPMAICGIRRGMALLTQDDVVIVSPDQGVHPIGGKIRRSILGLSRVYLRNACMIYNPRENELRLSIPDEGSQASMKVYRYSIGNDAWTVDTYQFPIRSLSFTRYAQSTMTVDQLLGTVDSLLGSVDDLGVTDRTVGAVYAMEGDSKRVARDDESRNNAALRDVDGAGLTIAAGWRYETGYAYAGGSIKKTHIVEIMVEYEAGGPATILFEESTDGGLTWSTFDSVPVVSTGGRAQILSVRKSIYREHVQLAVSTAATADMRVIAMHVFSAEGARIEDAR